MTRRVSVTVDIDTTGMDEIMERVSQLARQAVKVGVLEKDDRMVDTDHGGFGMAELAAVHEYGSTAANIEARAPIGTTFSRGRGAREVAQRMARAATDAIAGASAESVYSEIGEWAVECVRETIDNGQLGALQAETIQTKIDHSSPTPAVPLKDTGALRDAYSFEVAKE